MATKTDANGNVVSFALDTKDTYVGEKMTFNINVTTAGIDTSAADATAEDIKAGKTAYVNGELIEGTHTEQVFTTEEKTVTPTKSVQEIIPATADGLSKVTINAIPNEYIVTSDADATANNIQRGKTAYVNGVKITGTHDEATFTTEEKTVNPQEISVEVIPTGADGLSKVTVNPISSTYVGSGITQKTAATYTPGTTDQTIAASQYLSGAQTIKGDANLIADNIAKDVTIFGVTGTHEGGIDTTDATATAADIVKDKTAYVNDTKITGTLEVQNYYTGTDAPEASLGADGDLYFRTV